MERLTENRGKRTWKLFHVGWYLNIVLVALLLATSFYLYVQLMNGTPAMATRNAALLSMACLAAVVLLLGAGLSRYHARLEGQHLELKLAIKELSEQIKSLKKSA